MSYIGKSKRDSAKVSVKEVTSIELEYYILLSILISYPYSLPSKG